MKSKVKLSKFSAIITFAVILLFVFAFIASYEERDKEIVLAIIFVVMMGVSLYFYPKSLETNDEGLILHCGISDKKFRFSDISKVERCYPSPGGLRLCGSGGFLGYWGYFTDIVIGNYFGYYGDRNQCFLLKLKDGKQYVLSCEHSDEMVNVIDNNLILNKLR